MERQTLPQTSKVLVYKSGYNDFTKKEFFKTGVKKTCECFKPGFKVLFNSLNVKTGKTFTAGLASCGCIEKSNKLSDKIKKLANIFMLKGSSGTMMMSFIIKGASVTIRHLGSDVLNSYKCIHVYLKPV